MCVRVEVFVCVWMTTGMCIHMCVCVGVTVGMRIHTCVCAGDKGHAISHACACVCVCVCVCACACLMCHRDHNIKHCTLRDSEVKVTSITDMLYD